MLFETDFNNLPMFALQVDSSSTKRQQARPANMQNCHHFSDHEDKS